MTGAGEFTMSPMADAVMTAGTIPNAAPGSSVSGTVTRSHSEGTIFSVDSQVVRSSARAVGLFEQPVLPAEHMRLRSVMVGKVSEFAGHIASVTVDRLEFLAEEPRPTWQRALERVDQLDPLWHDNLDVSEQLHSMRAQWRRKVRSGARTMIRGIWESINEPGPNDPDHEC